MSKQSFAQLGVSSAVAQALAELAPEVPSPYSRRSFPTPWTATTCS